MGDISRITFFCMVLFFLSAPADAKRLALVIGNDNYASVAKLQTAGNDASAMAAGLRAAGFEVQLHRDLNYRTMVRVVETFTSGITGGDQVVVFFAGHGVQLRNGNYLLPTDIEANSENEVEKTAYELNALTEKLNEARASFSLVIVDACRDNPLKSNGRSVGATRGLSAIEPPKGQMIVYSASKGQEALDRLGDQDKNPNSVFTREFIARMNRPGVRIEDMMREVQDAVEGLARSVGYQQRPAIYNEARGNFYFFGPTTVQVMPSEAAVPESIAGQREDKLWDEAKAIGNKPAFEAYLSSYPEGRYAALAKIRINDTPAVPKSATIDISGTWKWTVRSIFVPDRINTVNADGTCALNTGTKCRWILQKGAERRIDFYFDDTWTHKMTLSDDGQLMTGTDNWGTGVMGMKGATQQRQK